MLHANKQTIACWVSQTALYVPMGGNGGKWGEIGVQPVPASAHGVGKDPGCLLSTQPSVGVSSPTGDSLLPVFGDCNTTHSMGYL